MRLERSPVARFLVTKHHQSGPSVDGFTGAAYWNGQFSNQETFDTWRELGYGVSLKLLGHHQDAEYNTDEAITNAWRAADSFRGGSPKAWLLRVVVNTAFDELRRRMRKPTDSIEQKQSKDAFEVKSTQRDADPVDHTEQAEIRAGIVRGITRLSDEQRDVFILCDLQGLKVKEASEVLGIALGTVKSRHSRARALMRNSLVKEEIV